MALGDGLEPALHVPPWLPVVERNRHPVEKRRKALLHLLIQPMGGHGRLAGDQHAWGPQDAPGLRRQRPPTLSCTEDLDQHDGVEGRVAKR